MRAGDCESKETRQRSRTEHGEKEEIVLTHAARQRGRAKQMAAARER
jgi:hypothetical protein